MSDTVSILSARGAFYRVPLSDQSSPGMYSVEGLTIAEPKPFDPNDDPFEDKPEDSPILIAGISFKDNDIVSQVSCLENVKVFYSFGQNFGQVSIAGEILLGPLGDVQTSGVKRLKDYFWQNRVSVRKTPISVSHHNEPCFVYLTGLDIMPVDSMFHILPFVLYGTLLDLSRQDARRVNPKSTVITSKLDDSIATALSYNPSPVEDVVYNVKDGKSQSETSSAPNSSLLGGSDFIGPQKPSNESAYAQHSGPVKNADAAIKNAELRNTPLKSADAFTKAREERQALATKVPDGTDPLSVPAVKSAVDKESKARAAVLNEYNTAPLPNTSQLKEGDLVPSLVDVKATTRQDILNAAKETAKENTKVKAGTFGGLQ